MHADASVPRRAVAASASGQAKPPFKEDRVCISVYPGRRATRPGRPRERSAPAASRTHRRPAAVTDATPAARSSPRRRASRLANPMSRARATRAGRSPGSRVIARSAPSQASPSRGRDWLSGCGGVSAIACTSCSPLTVAGTATELFARGARTAFPLPTRSGAPPSRSSTIGLTETRQAHHKHFPPRQDGCHVLA